MSRKDAHAFAASLAATLMVSIVVFQAGVEADMVALAAFGIAASVIGAFYYIKFVKVMFFDDASERSVADSTTAHWVLLVVTTAIVSPLGYLVTPSLGDLTDKAASALFLLP